MDNATRFLIMVTAVTGLLWWPGTAARAGNIRGVVIIGGATAPAAVHPAQPRFPVPAQRRYHGTPFWHRHRNTSSGDGACAVPLHPGTHAVRIFRPDTHHSLPVGKQTVKTHRRVWNPGHYDTRGRWLPGMWIWISW